MSALAPVVIIGAGISGLALAKGLSKHGIPFHVYESDESMTARTQGYRVRITDGGIESLKQIGSQKDFQKLLSTCNIAPVLSNIPSATINATSGTLVQSLFKPGTRLHSEQEPLSADRSVLRRNLLHGIEAHVTFGWRYHSFTETDNAVIVHFENNSDVEASVLVGADGVWSRIRQQLLPSYELLDTEGRLIFGKTELKEPFIQQFSENAMQGLTIVTDTALKCLLEPMRFAEEIQDLPKDYVYWVLFLRHDSAGTPRDITSKSPAEITTLARHLTRSWHPSLRCLFEYADSNQISALRVLSSGLTVPDWATETDTRRITLIGDAIHTMSPTAALGATTALQDVSTILTSIEENGLDYKVLRNYEHQMRIYVSEAISKSLIGGRVMFKMRDFEDLPVVEARSEI